MALLSKWLKKAVNAGLPFPHAYDPVPKQPSFRLLTAYVSFLIATISVIALHFNAGLLVASGVSIAYFALNMVFYMLKKLTKAKIDLDDQQIDLESDDTEDSAEKDNK